jgi:hypothetical protein
VDVCEVGDPANKIAQKIKIDQKVKDQRDATGG